MLETKGNSIIFGRCWTYKSGKTIFIWAPEVPFFGTRIGALLSKVPIFMCLKIPLLVPEQKFFYYFYNSNIPQNLGFSPCILHYAAKKIRDAFSRHFSDLTKKEKWSKIVSKTQIQPVPVMGSNFNQNDSPY